MHNYMDHVDHMDQGPLTRMLRNSPSEGQNALTELSLSDFEHGTYIVRVRSQLLGEDVYFVSDEKLFDRVPRGFVVYTARELRALRGVAKDCLKRIHRIKKTIDGEVLD